MGTLNEIQEGFREINEAENRVTIAKDGERADKKQQIREDIQFISKQMARNRELIAKLREQLRQSTIKGDQFKETIDNLTKQLQEKDQQLQQLRAELDAKDIHISALDETINNLNSDVSNLKTESAQKSQTISTQDQLHEDRHSRHTRDQALLEVGTDQNRAPKRQLYTGTRCQQAIRAAHHESPKLLVDQQISRDCSEINRYYTERKGKRKIKRLPFFL